jgi:hypothetical protein
MIQLNKSSAESEDAKADDNLKYSQEIVENVPVFSMKSDLAAMNNPGGSALPKNSAQPQNYMPVSIPKISDKQKNSPFLNPTPQKNSENAKIPPVQQIKSEARWEKLILIGVSIFLLLACGAGGYYYWITKQTGQGKKIVDLPPEPKEETVSFSIEKPNYLPIDLANSDSSKIKETLKKYVDKVSSSKAITPVEFIITDLKNNPASFPSFASQIGINFSSDLISSLSANDRFSLFIYNDNGNTRLGIAVNSVDDYKLKKSIYQEEVTLAKEIEPLFLDLPYDTGNKTFGSSSYSGTEIRYVNLNTSNEITVDYTIFQNELIIGTTKMTLRSIMDYTKNHSQAKVPSSSTETTNPIPSGN